MSLENPETWFMILRTVLLLAAFGAFAWALRASRRDAAMSFLRLSAQHAQALTEIQQPMDVFSPVTLGAFALLGLFSLVPVVYKRWKRRQVVRAAE